LIYTLEGVFYSTFVAKKCEVCGEGTQTRRRSELVTFTKLWGKIGKKQWLSKNLNEESIS